MSDGIILSPKHGVNPSVDCCIICGKEIGLVMFGKLKGNVEAPKRVCSGNVCDECKELLKTKVALLEVNNEHDSVRTGRYAFVPKESITVPNKGIMYITKKDFDNLFGNN